METAAHIILSTYACRKSVSEHLCYVMKSFRMDLKVLVKVMIVVGCERR